ncbi:MAG: hypothetical protein J3Q66DRAFT_386053 [Benniella sp.]|nr:MAG: hypothetical protein J3Q66DRAFT_386053 [Benniella sp.]
MKFLAVGAVAASSLVAMASADLLQMHSPYPGTVWTAGENMTVSWFGNCKKMGKVGRKVPVDLVTGPASAVRYVATLGHINCAGTNINAKFVIPVDIDNGPYALIVRTTPQPSYTDTFQIEGL